MNYQIKRECWNEKTFNGYEDRPYWRVEFRGNTIALSDDGKFLRIGEQYPMDWSIKEDLRTIISECKLNIHLT